MPKATRRRFLPPPRSVPVPPRQHCWIESDGYDRTAFAELVAATPPLGTLTEEGGAVIPHFRELLEDVFCLLFKLEPRRRRPEEVAPAAALGGALLDTLEGHPGLAALRTETQLDEAQAGLGTLLLGEELLALVRDGHLLPRGDLDDLRDLAEQEETLRARAEELADLGEVKAGEAARDATAIAARVAEAKLRQKGRNVGERLREMPDSARQALPRAAMRVAPQLGDAAEHAQAWGHGVGAGGRVSPARQIELGRRLVTNPKLKRLAGVVGRMRQHALALRKKTLERASEEVHGVAPGRDLEHLLPPELLALRHPLLKRDFARRLLEGQLLGYQLRGLEEKGRGPMIVCVDGSSSMEGEKEIWAKAVALTLLEIARRQRRLFRFVCFAGPEAPLFTLDLNPQEHHTVRVDRTLDVAEVFPGGGTDFEKPLDAAVECLRGARHRRSDIVLITDGECRVSPEWQARFLDDKTRLGFSLFSILIDVGPSTRETLEPLSDRLTTVSHLTDDAAGDLFRDL